MLDLHLQEPFVFPAGRVPRLNRAHPLCSQQHIVYAAVAQGNCLVDLVSGQQGTNTTTLGGVDQNGPYVWSNDSAGTATITMTGPATSFNFQCWGAIFQLRGTNRQFIWNFNATASGFFTINNTIYFYVAGGSQASFAVPAGHTYFCFQNNAVGTASQTRTFVCVDLTTGQVYMAQGASVDNFVISPIKALVVEVGTVCTNRLYAAFACGSVLVPPAVCPPATFYSIDQIMAGLKDPWGLWYA